jgi:hypothetical protein
MGGRGPVHGAGGSWRTFQGLPGNMKIDGNRRRATVSGRPNPGTGGFKMTATKRPFAACGKANVYVSHFTRTVLAPKQ